MEIGKGSHCMTGRVYIGTSGWHYKHWIGLFYPLGTAPKDMFSFYTRYFQTVELNNTFYRLPTTRTFDGWRDAAPEDFRYSLKASRFITHMKKLKDPEASTMGVFNGAERLGKKLGPILFQLPPRWSVDYERLAQFLKALPSGHQYVFEFRDKSWLKTEVFELLHAYNAAFCIHDLGGVRTPLEITADFSYVRFHGPGTAKYSGSYSRSQLKGWAERILIWQKTLKSIYVYFNNDIGGWAVNNATMLRQLVDDR
jgi:uncharacterized protein YecE (DUF72 family)